MKEMKRTENFKKNLKKEEWTAITTLRNKKDILIKPADKGGNIVITYKQDYLQEGLKQLSSRNHYEILEEDPTQEYSNQISQVLHQASNLNIIDYKTKKILFNKSPICYQRYINPTTQEDLL